MIEEKKSICELIELIKNHIQFLNKLNDQQIKKYSLSTYPIKYLTSFYTKKLLQKLQKRRKNSIIYSDILIWFANQMVSLGWRLEQFILGMNNQIKNQISISLGSTPGNLQKKHKSQSMRSTESSSQNRHSSSLSNYNQKIQSDTLVKNYINVITVETALKAPFFFLTQQIPSFVKVYASQVWFSNLQQKQSLLLFSNHYQKIINQYLHKQKSSLTNQINQIKVQEIQDQVITKFYQNIKKTKIACKFGYRFLFIAKLKLRAKKAKDNSQDRKYRIKQMIDGQNVYVQRLNNFIQYIKKPIQATNLVSKQQLYKIFSTIDSILLLHTQILSILKNQFQHYSKYQTYGDILSKKFPYFQIYIDYIQYANDAETLLLKLADDHQQIQDICSKFLKQKSSKASDQLKQPTFRIARYNQIINQIMKKTPINHPDYKKLKQAQIDAVTMLTKINKTVDITFRKNRLHQLELQLGTQQRPIEEVGREFLQQFQLFYVHEDNLVPVIAYVFSDLIIVSDKQTKQITKWLKINQNFYVRRQQDSKIYKNIIKIHSDGFVTFSAGPGDKNFSKAQNYYNLLQRVSQQNQQNNRMVYVHVIGTQQIGSTSFAKHTQYIIQIKYMGIRKFVHLRFSQMQSFVSKMQQHYGNDLHITKQQQLKKNWFNNHKSKTIQDRKRTIQQILQKMLNHQLVKKNSQYILNQLRIDTTFLKITQQIKNKRTSIHSSFQDQKQKKQKPLKDETQTTCSSIKSNKKENKDAQIVLCATQIKLGRDIFHDDIQIQLKKSQIIKIQIKINTMNRQQPYKLSITEFFSVQNVCHKVSKIIGLRMYHDFRLFHQIGKKQLRVLDQQQKLMKIFNFSTKQQKSGLFSEIISSVKKVIVPDSQPKLVFKKYYFLPIEIQQAQCRKDLTRLRLLVNQIFSQVKQMKYQLSFDQYLLFLAMMIYIDFQGEVPKKLDPYFVTRLIPQTIFKLKNYTQQQWLQKCVQHLQKLTKQINKIIIHNTQQLKNKKSKYQPTFKTALHFGHRHLCSQIVINKIKTNPIYGSNLFYVQPYKQTYEKLISENKKMAYNMWLAIKVQGLNLLTPSSKQTVLQLKYQDIQKIFVFSQSIIFKMQGHTTCQYRFNTYQSFQISQLVDYNKCLNNTLQQLQRDDDLVTKAQRYKQQLQTYLNTCDNYQRGVEKIQKS